MYELVSLGFKLLAHAMGFLLVYMGYRNGYSDAKKEGWIK